MQSRLNPYISFKNNAREALEFYHGVFGGKLDLSTFGESMPTGDAEADKLIMHGMLEADNGMVLMAADTPPGMEHHEGSNISISLSGDNHDELMDYYNKLLEGGSAPMPIDKAPWGDTFGMLTDKFGVNWMVNIAGAKVQ